MLHAIFDRSPLILKRIMLNAVAFQNYNKRYNKDFSSSFECFKNLWNAPISEIETYQKKELIKLLIECSTYSEWYKSIFLDLKISPSEIKENPYKVLQKLPILKKIERKEYVETIINKNPNRKIVGIGHTSGTSGLPMINYIDQATNTISFALWKRFHHTLGFKTIHPKTVRFSGNIIIPVKQKKPPFWLYNNFEKQLYMSTYHMTNNNIPFYIKKINTFKPQLLDGYPSAIFNLANYINKNNITLKFIPKAIATTSETLYDEQRVEIEKAFKCKVYNQYASSEGSPFITECQKGNMHLNLDSGIFELLNENYKPAKPGEIAKLVVTSLRNYKTPLIRYDIQDSVLLTMNSKKCECGCNMPFVEKIMGREDDLLIASNGSYIGMTAYKIFKYAEHINKAQIIQKNKNLFIVNVEVTDEFGISDIEFLKNKVKGTFGDSSQIQINKVQSIPLGANGKYKAVIRDFKL